MIASIGDDPRILRTMATGYPDGEPEYPHCPLCGEECGSIYKDGNGDILGCEQCVSVKNAWDVDQCFRERG